MALIGQLDGTDEYFKKAEDTGIQDEEIRTEMAFYRGWSHFVRNNYRMSLHYWQSVSPKLDKRYPNLELAKSYSLYYLATQEPERKKALLKLALSNLVYMHNELTPQAENIKNLRLQSEEHVMIFSKLTIIENNMGAIFELLNNEQEALQHYWKSIEYSKKISKENEVAQMNIRLSFKREGLEPKEKYPVIMDFISPYLKDQVL